MFSIDSNKPYALYIEDDADDVELLNLALSDTKILLDIVHVWNGVEALNLLNDLKPYRPLPSVIFLDINMSKLNGKETYLCLQADKDVSKIPVIMLSASTYKNDVEFFNSKRVPYIVKPGNMQQFKNDINTTLKSVLAFDFDFSSSRRNTDAA